MFNWTTTTILNSLEGINGESLVSVAKTGYKGASDTNPILRIKKDFIFESRYVDTVYKATAADPEICEMTIDGTKLIEAVQGTQENGTITKTVHARLAFYIALEGSEEAIYANDGYQKGKPFSVGFDVPKGATAATVLESIKSNAEKYGAVFYGKKVFELTVSDTTLTLKGTHEYQRFKDAAILVDDLLDETVADAWDESIKKDVPSTGDVFSLKVRGKNGFGTYQHLTKDLRLPTIHNTQWLALHSDERVAVGAKYNQYILTYCAPSMANPGLTVVGQHNNSVTTHVFWVNANIAKDFEAALADASISLVSVPDEPEVGVTNSATNHEQSETVSHKKKATSTTSN